MILLDVRKTNTLVNIDKLVKTNNLVPLNNLKLLDDSVYQIV